MASRLDTLATRIALGVLALVAVVIAASVGLAAWSLQSQTEASLASDLQAAAESTDALLGARAELLDAVGSSLAGTPMFRAAIAANADDATLADLVDRRRAAMKLDLVGVLDPERKLRIASPAIGEPSAFASLEPGKPGQVMAGGYLYIAVLHPLEAGPQLLGYTVAGNRLGPRFAETLARQSGVDVLLLSHSAVLGSSTRDSSESELFRVASAPGAVREVGSLRGLALQRGALRVVLAKSSAVEFARYRSTLLVLVLAGLVGAALAGLAGLFVVRRAMQPLQLLTDNVHGMVSQTDFTRPFEVRSTREIRTLSQAFTQLVTMLRQVLTQIRQATDRIGAGSEAMVLTVTKSEGAANEHATSIRETTDASGELVRSARAIAASSGSVAENAQKTLAAARAGLEGAAAFTTSMSRLRAEHAKATEVMGQLAARMQQIGRVVEFINDVADKSELLALNAELEGQRAGAVGQSFSLVATEMRRLAENVTKSTREIETLIQDVKESTQEAVGATQSGHQASERASAAAASVSHSLKLITSMAEKTATQVDAISTSTQAQTNSTDALSRSLTRLQAIAQESLDATRNLAGANGDLGRLAHELDQLVGSFKL